MNRIGATSIAILKHCMEMYEFTFLDQKSPHGCMENICQVFDYGRSI